jgi:putative transcriptional regulator
MQDKEQKFKSLKGTLLLDGGQLRGSFFHRSVVLVCEHNAEGAFGLVLNQPTDKTIGEVAVTDIPESLKELALFLGGPVQTTALSYLHSDSFLDEANVMENLNLGHSLDTLLELGESFSSTRKVKCFAGYAGWSAGQLEGELARKSWVVHPATIDQIFSDQPQSLWKTILQEKGWQYRLIAEGPDDLSWN